MGKRTKEQKNKRTKGQKDKWTKDKWTKGQYPIEVQGLMMSLVKSKRPAMQTAPKEKDVEPNEKHKKLRQQIIVTRILKRASLFKQLWSPAPEYPHGQKPGIGRIVNRHSGHWHAPRHLNPKP